MEKREKKTMHTNIKQKAKIFFVELFHAFYVFLLRTVVIPQNVLHSENINTDVTSKNHNVPIQILQSSFHKLWRYILSISEM